MSLYDTGKSPGRSMASLRLRFNWEIQTDRKCYQPISSLRTLLTPVASGERRFDEMKKRYFPPQSSRAPGLIPHSVTDRQLERTDLKVIIKLASWQTGPRLSRLKRLSKRDALNTKANRRLPTREAGFLQADTSGEKRARRRQRAS